MDGSGTYISYRKENIRMNFQPQSLGEQILGACYESNNKFNESNIGFASERVFNGGHISFCRWNYVNNCRGNNIADKLVDDSDKKRIKDTIINIFNSCRVDINQVSNINNMKKLYKSYQVDRNGFVTIYENDKNYAALLKGIARMTSNNDYRMQVGLIPNSIVNRRINEEFGTLRVNNHNQLVGCLHVKKKLNLMVHHDYTFLFGTETGSNRRFILLRFFDKVDNCYTWENVRFASDRPDKEDKYIISNWNPKKLY